MAGPLGEDVGVLEEQVVGRGVKGGVEVAKEGISEEGGVVGVEGDWRAS